MAGGLPDLTGPQSARRPRATQPDLHGLAELAFASLSHCDESAVGQPLGLLHTESLELDLTDPAQRQFGDYELLEQIGEGGMGVVYRARQNSLDREVALKLLSAGPWASKDFIARFEREAQNAARMQHPNIVTVFEAGSCEGLHFMSMRLIEGRSLSTLLKSGERLAPRQAAALLRTVAEAVAYAHSLGVLHLDLKPGNILIDGDGIPYVADFGLARRLDRSALALDNDEVSGTPSYMAPEQAQVRSSRLTAATDVWGLGAILYELLTGQPPFRAASAQATLKLVLQGAVRAPRRLQPRLPPDLQAITLRCLARDTTERYPSARALAEDLARYLEGRPVIARPLNVVQRSARWARREPRLAATALLAFGLLAGGVVATTQQWYRADRNADTARANEATANARLWDSRNDAVQRFMEEGQDWQAAPLLLANLKEMEAAGNVRRAQGARFRLGLVRNRNPVLIDAIPAQKPAVAIAFDASGTRMATSGTETGLLLFDAADGKQLLKIPGRPHEVWTRLRFTDDGRVLLAQRMEMSNQSPRPAGAHMRRLDTATGNWLAPPAPFADADAQSYSADGRYAVLTLPDGRAQFWSTSPWRALSPLRALPFSDEEDARLIAPDGSFFALNGPEGAVTLVDPRSLAATRIPLGAFGRIVAWATSPDARWLALGDAAGHAVVVDVATHAVRRLEPRPFFGARGLTFSGDGGWLALAARDGGVYLWSWPEGRLLVPPFSASTSPTGTPLAEHVELDRARGLVFVTDETANTALWQVAPAAHANDPGLARRVTAGLDVRTGWGVEAAAWHPATGLIATAIDERVRLMRLRAPVLKAGKGAPLRAGTLRFDGRHLVEVDGHQVRVVDALTEQPLGAPIAFAQPPTFAELTPDGATLVVASGREVHILDVASGKARVKPIVLGGAPARFDLSPDGQRIAIGWLSGDAPDDRNVSEMVVIHGLADGRRLGGPEPLPGPTNEELAFSPDGSRLLVRNPRDFALRDGVTLAPVAGPLAHFLPRGRDEDARKGYVRLTALDADNRMELVYGRHDGARYLHELRRYAPDGTFSVAPQRGWSQAIVPLSNGLGTAVASGDDPLNQVIGPDGVSRTLPDMGDDARGAALALSPDGRWLVRTRLDGVLLFDLERMARVATLNVALPQPDEVMQVAFSPDGRRLLGRSVRNRYLVWDFTPDERPADAIAREQGLRDLPFNVVKHGVDVRDLDAAERRALHAADPGVPPAPPVPVAAAAIRVLPGGAIPLREPAVPPGLLDLTPYYTFGLTDSFIDPAGESGDFTWLPRGVQRLLGVDYDLRGGVRMTRGASMRLDLAASSGPRAFGAIHALLRIDDAADDQRLAQMRLDYADGTHAKVPLRLGKHFGDYWRKPGAEASALIAAAGWDSRWYWNYSIRSRALAVRIPNPHPERPVKTLTLSNPTDAGGAPIVLALTLGPPVGVRAATGKE
ncbi:MAG: serine/threonine protein kinase [Rhodanobacteraceae bacterium]|nr:MAG: serine/threonine protein kinase [Rhodanobacteraceae bacterium]